MLNTIYSYFCPYLPFLLTKKDKTSIMQLHPEIKDMNYDNLDEIERDELVSSLNKKMLSAARGLKFELATIYRDQINNLKKELIIDNEK